MMAVNSSDSRACLAVMTHHMANYRTLGGALDYAPGGRRHCCEAQSKADRAKCEI